jgi:hypothetical protein
LNMSVGSERVGVYEGACWTVSSFLKRRVVDSWRVWMRGRREGGRTLVLIRAADLHVDIVG